MPASTHDRPWRPQRNERAGPLTFRTRRTGTGGETHVHRNSIEPRAVLKPLLYDSRLRKTTLGTTLVEREPGDPRLRSPGDPRSWAQERRLWPGFRAPTVAPRAGIRSPPPALRTNPDQREGSAPEAVVALNIRTALDNRLRPRDGLDSRQPGQSRRCRRPSSMSKKRAGAEPTRVAALRIRTRGRATASVARSNLFVHRGGRTSSPAFAPSSPCAHPFHRHHPWSDGRRRSALRAARGTPSPCRS